MAGTVYLDNKLFEANIVAFKQLKRDKLRCEMLLEDLQGRSDRPSALGDKRREHARLAIEYGRIYALLAADILLLAQNIIGYKKFANVDYDDAVQEFVLLCLEKVDCFDPTYVSVKTGKKAKAFNYMTTCIFNHYKQLYRYSKNYLEMKRRLHDWLYAQSGHGRMRRKAKNKGQGE